MTTPSRASRSRGADAVGGRLTAAEAAQRLGVKLPTVYAYVSRGHLHSERAPGGRISTFSAAEVERLARRGRPRRSSRAPLLELEISTSLTEVARGELRFRGYDAVELAGATTFESVAELLLLGELPARPTSWPEGEVYPQPPGSHLDGLRITTALAAAADPFAADLRPEAVAATMRRLVASLVASMPRRARRVPRLQLADGTVVAGSLAQQLAGRLGGRPVDAAFVGLVNAVLCLLADHELAASTLAARVAASARADPYGVVGAGLGPFSGTLHGAASRHVRGLLDRAEDAGSSVALAEALQLHRHVPGFGHPLYPHGDPRAVALWRRLEERWAGHERMAVVEAVRTLAMERTQVHPNIDFTLGAMGHLHGLPHDAGEALFGVARSAGWIAHAIEEYGERPLRFRPRARYVGPPPRELTGPEAPAGPRTRGARR